MSVSDRTATLHVSAEELARLHGLLTSLEEALLAESAALRGRDVTALLEAVAAKRTALERITSALHGSSLSLLLEGPGTDIDSLVPDSETWTAITARLRSCHQLNESTGGAIAALLHTARNALELIGIPSQARTYDTSGQNPVAHPERRTLAVC